MPYDLDRIAAGLLDPDVGTALSAATALEQALKEELDAGRVDWEPLVALFLPPLIEGLGHPHKGVQVHSANCLQFLSFQSEAVIPALREAMQGPDTWRAWGAGLVTARMGLWFPEMARVLQAAMGAPDRDVRWAAASCTLQLGRSRPEAVAAAKATLLDPNPLARKMAAYLLGSMGGYAEVEPELAARLDDPDRDARRAVILAIDKLPRVPQETKERIAALRKDPDEFIRRTASAAAAKFEMP